jgi:hypothetical integral membrane protein (TIGR02206 family)
VRFQAFSSEHFVLLGLFVLGCVGFAVLGRRLRDSPLEAVFRRTFAVAIPLFTLPLQVLQLLPGDFTMGTSLPLQVCDLAWMLATFALFTRSLRASQVLYYWALTLVTQAIVTPSLQQAFPDPRFFMFWGMHFLTVWAAVYLTFAGAKPSWSGYRFAFAVTAAWAAAVMVFNAFTGTDYGYLNRKPKVASLLDLLGPWPWYIGAELVVVAAIWALITVPWLRRTAQGEPRRPTVRGAS